MLLDIHTHKPAPYPDGIVSIDNLEAPLLDGQLYSVGIHPWNTAEMPTQETWNRLEALASDPRVAAIGECGVDLLKGGQLFRQLQILKRQIEISEKAGKPLILHCVKGADIILGLKRDFNPVQAWIIHGFRGNPRLGRQLTDKGLFLSFGEKFNAETVAETPADRLLAETDESMLSIAEIIGRLSVAANRDVMEAVRANMESLIR